MCVNKESKGIIHWLTGAVPVKELQPLVKCWVMCVQLLEWCQNVGAFSLNTGSSLAQENGKPARCTCGQFHSLDIFLSFICK